MRPPARMTILPTLTLLTMMPVGSPVTWSFSSTSAADGSVLIELTAQCEQGWHIYATELPSNEGPIATSFRFTPSDAYKVIGELKEPEPKEQYDPNFAMTVLSHSGAPRFVLNVMPRTHEPFMVDGQVEFMVCNDRTCLPPVVVPFSITVIPAMTK